MMPQAHIGEARSAAGRPSTARTVLAFLLLLVAVALLATMANAQTEPPTDGDWVVGDITVIQGREVVLNGNLTVTGNLTLEDVDLKLNSSWGVRYHIDVRNGGRMTVKDVDGDPFTVGDASVISSTNPFIHYTWQYRQGSILRLEASIIRDCGIPVPDHRGLLIETDDASVINCTFWSCNFGIHVRNSRPWIKDTHIYRNDGYGIYVEDGWPRVENCILYDNYDAGAFVVNATGAVFSNCTFRDHEWAGLYATQSLLNVHDCEFLRNQQYGIRYFESCEGEVLGCTVDGTEWVGIYLGERCDPDLSGNEVFNVSNRGTWVYKASPNITDHHVHHCGNDSMFIYDSPILLKDSVLEDCGRTGLIVSDTRGVELRNCVIRRNGNNGVFIGSLWTGMSTGVLRDCVLEGNGRAGLYLNNESQCGMFNGSVRDNAIYGIYCHPTSLMQWFVQDVSSVVNETLRIEGTIWVDEAGELVIRNSTVVIDAEGAGENVYVAGTLRLLDHDGDRLTPQDAPELTALEEGQVVIVTVDGRMEARNGNLVRSQVLVHEGSFDAEGCVFQETEEAVVAFWEVASVTIQDCTFSDIGTSALRGRGSITVEGCSFSRAAVAISCVLSDNVSVVDCSFFLCQQAVVLGGVTNATLQYLRMNDCDEGINASSVQDLAIVGLDMRRSRSHGIRLIKATAVLEDCQVEGSGAGGLVVDGSDVRLLDCSFLTSKRAGIMGNDTDLRANGTVVAGTAGIGIWLAGDGSATYVEGWLSGSEAYDIRLEGGVVMTMRHTTIDAGSVRVFDQSILEVWSMMGFEVLVDPDRGLTPPGVVGYLVHDSSARLVEAGDLGPGNRYEPAWFKELRATATEVDALSPYNVTVIVAGRETTVEVELKGRTFRTLYVEVELDLVVSVPPQVHEGVANTFDASASVAYPFNITTIEWRFSPDTHPDVVVEGLVVEGTFASQGEHRVMVTLLSGEGYELTEELYVTVLDMVPVPSIVSDVPGQLYEDEELQLEGVYETAVDPIIVQSWTFGDGASGTGPSVTHNWTTAGTYLVVYTVTDSDGSTAEAQVEVRVINRPPVAVVPWTTRTVSKGTSVFFDGAGSHDTPSDNRSLSYAWDFDDGVTDAGAQVVHTFSRPGMYFVTLKVTDDDGAASEATIVVTVTNMAPTIGAIEDRRLTDTAGNVDIPLSGLVADADDPDDRLNLTALSVDPGKLKAEVGWDEVTGWFLRLHPVEGREGRVVVLVQVEDPDGAKGETTFNVTVELDDGGLIGGDGSNLVLVLAVAFLAAGAVVVAYVMVQRRRGGGGDGGGGGADDA